MVILTHEYFLVFYGVVIWYVAAWSFEKNKYDRKGKDFSFRDWKRKTYDNFIVTLVVAPLVVVFDDELLALYNQLTGKDVQLGRMIYLFAGPVTDFLYRLIAYFKNGNS